MKEPIEKIIRIKKIQITIHLGYIVGLAIAYSFYLKSLAILIPFVGIEIEIKNKE